MQCEREELIFMGVAQTVRFVSPKNSCKQRAQQRVDGLHCGCRIPLCTHQIERLLLFMDSVNGQVSERDTTLLILHDVHLRPKVVV